MKPLRLLKKAVVLATIRIGWLLKPGLVTRLYAWYLRSEGARIEGMPNYLSARIWFDGTDYSLITLGEGCTISSNVRILTHDAAINTVAKELGLFFDPPRIRIRPVRIGRYSFVGTGSVIMPGADIGPGCIIGAGSVVRGTIPPLSIVVGSPGRVVGSVEEYLGKTGATKPGTADA
ncbi:acyltransferase [Luteimonas sp. SJ-92]|uniref:Acyltransferase n=1 Tax=Luteimonas salinisoli TaxID=2752307 RepID=A0A853J9G3_9GAMM|nr:acyltransferase [Luteimonas salinisoli]NZA25836.1 acyltransferase [Luteimonas salinisoli]